MTMTTRTCSTKTQCSSKYGVVVSNNNDWLTHSFWLYVHEWLSNSILAIILVCCWADLCLIWLTSGLVRKIGQDSGLVLLPLQAQVFHRQIMLAIYILGFVLLMYVCMYVRICNVARLKDYLRKHPDGFIFCIFDWDIGKIPV